MCESLWSNFSLTTNLEEVSRFILELNEKKDPGPMAIPANFLRHNVDVVAPVIVECINTIFRTGRVPATWKQCYIIPIPKKGAMNEISNYRGIAIQSCIPKIMDRIITRMLYESVGPIIKESQHGFMKGKSTTTNLAEMAQFLHDNSGHQVDVIYFDFSKAFDQVRHDLLAIKLCKLSIPYNFLRVIMKFIIGRVYVLKINGVPTGISISPASSVPQGSHFGPICFVIFTNDLDVPNLRCYADDTKVFRSIKTMEDRNDLQKDVDRVATWSTNNQLTRNVGKTYHMSYGKQAVDSLYSLNHIIIEKCVTVRDLGVTFDSELTFKPHIQSIARRLSQMAGAARRFCLEIKSNITINRIFNIYMQPIIDYGSIIWNQRRLVTNTQITLVVKRITRFALNITYLTSASNYICFEKRCELLNIDLPDVRLKAQAAIFGLKILKGETLTTLKELFDRHLSTHPYITRRRSLFNNFKVVPKKSPAFFIMDSLGEYQAIINVELSTTTNKANIKKFNSIERIRVADQMQARSRGPSLLSQGNSRYHL